MKRQTKYLIWLISALLVFFLPSSALAWSYSISPAVKEIANLSLGGKAEFNLIIHNKDNVRHTFVLTTYNPEESERRPGRIEFPDSDWISFSPQVEVQADSKAEVEVIIAIPPEQEWADKDWEIWLSIIPEDKDLLVVNYYIRLLVSTNSEVSEVKASSTSGLIPGIVVGVILLGCGVYYFKRKTKTIRR